MEYAWSTNVGVKIRVRGGDESLPLSFVYYFWYKKIMLWLRMVYTLFV